MDRRRLWASLIVTAFTLVVLCATLVVSTYAWFTFDPATNVTPMEGNISDGDTNLLISNRVDGPFEVSCKLTPTVLPEILQPVSTQDLSRFFASVGQNRAGITTSYKEITDTSDERYIKGEVFLQCLGSDCDVFFNKDTMKLGADAQILAAGRLGLKFTGEDKKPVTYVFSLDALGDTSGAESTRTVDVDRYVVVGTVNTDGSPNYEDDPAVPISEHMYGYARAKKLCTVHADEVVKVEYWMYLEGCDDECSNPVQKRDVTLMLGFAGEKSTGDTAEAGKVTQ